MPGITIQNCKDQITEILSGLKWEIVSRTNDKSDIPDTTKRVFQSGIFQVHVYTDNQDEKFISVKFLIKQSCTKCIKQK